MNGENDGRVRLACWHEVRATARASRLPSPYHVVAVHSVNGEDLIEALGLCQNTLRLTDRQQQIESKMSNNGMMNTEGFWVCQRRTVVTEDVSRLTKSLETSSAVTVPSTAGKPRNLQYYMDHGESLKSCLME
jgi:hypothetical protein